MQQPLKLWADGFNVSIIAWGGPGTNRPALVLGDKDPRSCSESSPAAHKEPRTPCSSYILGALLSSSLATDDSALLPCGITNDDVSSKVVGISAWVISGDREHDLIGHALEDGPKAKSSPSERVVVAVRTLEEAERVIAAARVSVNALTRRDQSTSTFRGTGHAVRRSEHPEFPAAGAPSSSEESSWRPAWNRVVAPGGDDCHVFVQLLLVGDHPVRRISSLTLVDLAEARLPDCELRVAAAAGRRGEAASGPTCIAQQLVRFHRLLSEISTLHTPGKRMVQVTVVNGYV